MQVDFGVYKSGKLVSKRLVAPGRVGSNWGYYTVPTTGDYYLVARCEGGNDNRCAGGGSISKN